MRRQLGITIVSALVVAIVGILYPKSLATLFSGVATVAILGFGVAWWTSHVNRSAATEQFYETLDEQLQDNARILGDAHELAAKAKYGFGPGFLVRIPYLSAWDLLVGLGGEHYVPPSVVSTVAKLHRKFAHVTRWQGYLAEVYMAGIQQDEPQAKSALEAMYTQAVTGLDVLAGEAEKMMAELRSVLPAQKRKAGVRP